MQLSDYTHEVLREIAKQLLAISKDEWEMIKCDVCATETFVWRYVSGKGVEFIINNTRTKYGPKLEERWNDGITVKINGMTVSAGSYQSPFFDVCKALQQYFSANIESHRESYRLKLERWEQQAASHATEELKKKISELF